jgi:hypothetical protein
LRMSSGTACRGWRRCGAGRVKALNIA